METSLRKYKANARNARLSSGPGDTSRTRLNAAKHQNLSKDVLIRTGNGMESEKEYREFGNSIIESLAPVGALEESLVQDLINISWRKRRIITHESALISQQSATAMEDWVKQNLVTVDSEELSGDFLGVDFEGFWRGLSRPQRDLPDLDSLGLEFDSTGKGSNFEKLAKAFASHMAKQGSVQKPAVTRVSPFTLAAIKVYEARRTVIEFQGSDSDLNIQCIQTAVIDLMEEWVVYLPGITVPGKRMSCSAEELDAVITSVCEQEGICREEFWTEVDDFISERLEAAISNLNYLALLATREKQLASLPDDVSLAKIQRYEAHLSREYYKALHELQRIQVARLNAEPSAPIAVDIS